MQGMVCPKCGSEDWHLVPWYYCVLLGLGTAGCGVWLIVFIIGIPIVIVGLAISLLGFTGSFYRCNRCNGTWRKPPK